MVDSQLAQLAERVPFNSPSALPRQSQTNPSSIMKPDSCKAITLRSGTSYEGPKEGNSKEKKEGEESVGEDKEVEEENVVEKERSMEKKNLKHENTTLNPSEARNLDGSVPFPGRLAERNLNDKFAKFLSVMKNLHINLPFIEVVTQMPSYSRFLKDILTNKRKLNDELITLPHQEDYPISGELEDVPIKVGHIHVSCNFVVMDMEEDVDTPLILGREVLKTLGAVINCKNNNSTCEVADEKIVFEYSKLLKTPIVEKCYRVDVVNEELDRLGRVMMKPQDPMVEALTCKEEYHSQEVKEFVMAMEETQIEEDHEQQEDKEELELEEKM
ncbi:uncharacterized protein LOC110690357 [Chenopodium quinoa]|uniref:uncharacterized protein LOC110690357 n=1 Tax=Chenopodium quinoa TaxID=63459 RepID=UPI000B781A9B|nr:uncharacterized protein LOC110690357 [Chenopodium quinoa]